MFYKTYFEATLLISMPCGMLQTNHVIFVPFNDYHLCGSGLEIFGHITGIFMYLNFSPGPGSICVLGRIVCQCMRSVPL